LFSTNKSLVHHKHTTQLLQQLKNYPWGVGEVSEPA